MREAIFIILVWINTALVSSAGFIIRLPSAGGVPWSQDLSTTGATTYECFTISGRARVTHSFVAANSGTLDEIQLYVVRSGSPTTETMDLNIRADSTGTPGAIITNGSIDNILISSLPSSAALHTFTFTGSPQLTASSTYHIEVHGDQISADSSVSLYFDTASSAGSRYISSESISWSLGDATALIRGNASGTTP